jgi:hypothetical protein
VHLQRSVNSEDAHSVTIFTHSRCAVCENPKQKDESVASLHRRLDTHKRNLKFFRTVDRLQIHISIDRIEKRLAKLEMKPKRP